MDEGVNHLLTQLCDLQLASHQKPTVAQPKLSRHQKKKRLWNRSWNVLFMFLHGPHRKQVAAPRKASTLSEINTLLALAFELRTLRKFDDANDLEDLVEKFTSDGIDPTKRSVLRLLIALSDVHKKNDDVIIGHKPLNLPVVFPRRVNHGFLPEGPLCHGDTHIQREDDPYYTHFPSELFEIPGVSLKQLGKTENDFLDPSVFCVKPGMGLRGNGVFNVKGNLEDSYEKQLQCSLFGALTYSRTMSMDIVLDLPDIQDTWNTHILDLKPARVQEMSEDEGFVDRTPSTAESLTSCSTPLDLSALEDEDERDIWELALEHKPSHHYTWERRGQPPMVVEKPFLTEAGADVFDHLYQAYQRRLRLLDPELTVPPAKTISTITLVKNTLYMLIGVPSDTFQLHNKSFSIAEGTTVSGLSPEGVTTILRDIMVCGSQYVRLVHFSRPSNFDSHHHAGLVFQAFSVGIRKYLQHYRACVLSISKRKTLLQITALLDKLREQVRVLSTLCWCEEDLKDDSPSDFPTGVKLLSYLYDKTFEAASSLHYPMLLSLFHTSCGPYIMFVREWVFQGNCHDIYGEFMIHINEDYLRFRDRHYWTHGYVVMARNPEDCVPPFLEELANDIFVCGKAINLLRLIAPKHFLLALDADTPTVSISFAEEEIRSIEQQCRTYRSRMQEVARQQTKAREDMIRKKAQDKQDVLVKARKTAMEQIAKFQERAEAIKKAQDQKKRAAFAELKEHMEKDILRRASEKEQEKEEDTARAAANNRQEVLEAAVEEELAKTAREELISEYEKMTVEVAHREQRAVWRVARYRLETRRVEFLAEDEGKWQAELAAKPFVPELDESIFEEAVKLVSESAREEEVGETESTDRSPVDDATDSSVDGEPAVMSDDQKTETVEAESPTTEETGPTRHGTHSTQPDGDNAIETQRSSIKMSNVMHATKESESPIPRWAREGAKTALPPFGLEVANQDQMPSWARKVLEDGDSPTGEENDAADGDHSEGDFIKAGTPHETVEEKDEQKPKRLRMTTWAASRVRASLSQDDASWPQTQLSPLVARQDLQDSAQPKASIKMSRAMSASTESDEVTSSAIPHRKSMGHVHVGQESTEEAIPKGIRMSASMGATLESTQELNQFNRKNSVGHAGQESIEEPMPKGIRKSASMGATLESTQELNQFNKKTVEGQHVGQQSEQNTRVPQLKTVMGRHASNQSEIPKLRVVHRNSYGHPSQLSMISNYELIKPKIKMVCEPSVFDDVDFGNFLVKPRHRHNGVGINRDRYSTKESEFVDHDKIKREKFKAQNVHGHSSDSTVQRLLYGEDFGRGRISRDASLQEEHEDYDTEPWTEIEMEDYNTDMSMLNEIPVVDLMNSIGAESAFSSWGDYAMSARSDVTAYQYISLPSLTKRSVTGPLATQIQLVNQCLVNYFTAELEVDAHFVALRRFLLMQDGEFGQSLSDQLFEKLAQNPMPHEMLNPMYLNNVLSRALRSSIHGDSEYARLVSFALKYIPGVLNHHAPNALDCLELTYKVDWPVNVVVTESGLNKYCRVFSFMLQLKRAVWVLKDVWHRLKKDAIIYKASTSSQFSHLQLCRHEMQHFVKVMQGYIANQVIHVTWQEFQEDMARNVVSLDDLHRCHTDYLDKCVKRCLLSKDAGPVMKIIKDIFELILEFRKQLISYDWHHDAEVSMTHPAYDNMCHVYKNFNSYSRFLYKVVRRLDMRGFQTHLQELLLRLNFNSYYSDQ